MGKLTKPEKIARKLSWQQRAAMRSIAHGKTSAMQSRTDDSLGRKGLVTPAGGSVYPLKLTDLGKEVFAAMPL